MHDFEDSFRNQRKFRVRGKWELILVLLVVIAGVVVTTIAVLKAKEKRESLHLEENANLPVIDSSSPRLVAVDNQQPPHDVRSPRDHGQPGRPTNSNEQQQKSEPRRNQHHNRYQAEREFGGDGYESAPESRRVRPKPEISPNAFMPKPEAAPPKARTPFPVASAPTPETHLPMLRYDGLPGYPPPVGFDPTVFLMDKEGQQNNPNVEFAANSAGFILPDLGGAASSTEESQAVGKSPQPKWSGEETSSEPVAVIAPAKPTWPGPTAATSSEPHIKPAPAPVTSNKAIEMKPQMVVHQKAPSMITNVRVPMPNGGGGPMQRSSHNQEMIRVVGSLDHGDYLTPHEMLVLQQGYPELFINPNAPPKHMVPISNRRSKRNVENEENSEEEQLAARRKRRRSQRSKLAEEKSSTRSKVKSHGKRRKDRVVESAEGDTVTTRKRRKKETLQHKKKPNKNKTSRNRYSKEESKKVEKRFDILGSGNFEIIRGGILDKAKDEKGYKLKSESVAGKNRKIDKKDRPEETSVDYGQNNNNNNNNNNTGNEAEEGNGETEDDSKGKEGEEGGGGGGGNDTNEGFEPFNFDLFGTDPMLGFQGYDNFDASRNDLTKVRM